jgi:RNA polymerase sigma-70 factor, ECF subfamily
MVVMPAFSPGSPAPGGNAAPGPPDLSELLRASARGDEQAFAELYGATSRRLYGLVVRVVRDPAQAEEVAQEAFLEIWRTSARFDSAKGSAMSWMMTIAHRKAVDRVRSAQAASRRDETYEAATQDRAYDITAEEVERSLDSQRVRQALASLTETQRGAVQLAYFGGYTHNEVAALLGIPLGTAKTRIRDGLIRLRDTLGMQP